VKILLDECVPWPLSRHLKSHQCTNPHRLGWDGLKNGDLLAEAETKFEAFITSDQSLRYQQNRKGRIVKEAVGLDFTQQREILMFVKFLKTKKQGDDDADFKKFSLESAMRGMEDEPDFYDET